MYALCWHYIFTHVGITGVLQRVADPLKKDKRTIQLTFVLTMFGRWSLKCSTVAARLISLAAVRGVDGQCHVGGGEGRRGGNAMLEEGKGSAMLEEGKGQCHVGGGEGRRGGNAMLEEGKGSAMLGEGKGQCHVGGGEGRGAMLETQLQPLLKESLH